MDSLTQITLGAAMGEMVAGRKIGNRAMLWGAIAGTIPDLDVFIGSIFMDDLGALAFHRGITHSLIFAIIFPFFLVYLCRQLYESHYYQKKFHRIISFVTAILLMLSVAFILNFIPSFAGKNPSVLLIIISIGLVSYFSWRLWKYYLSKNKLKPVEMHWIQWYLLFFIAIVTHPLLDCCTTYGTQIFQPFSDLRVSWNNISVFDPAYTLPFLIFLLIASFVKKERKLRSVLNYGGIVISSVYMIWTFSNKIHVNKVFRQSLDKEEIEYSRYLTSPTIANNLLWNCVAESEDHFHMGLYSILDKEKRVKGLINVPKNEHLVAKYEDGRTIKTLNWFSDGYLSYNLNGNGIIQARDLRYGRFTEGDDPENFIFKFDLIPVEDKLEFSESRGGPPTNQSDWLKEFLERIKGI